MPYRPKDVLRALKKAGFVEERQRGSHIRLKHPNGRRITVPFHNQDLKTGTFRSILKQAGLSLEAFQNLV